MYEDHMEEFVCAYRGLKPLFQGETKGTHNSQTVILTMKNAFFKTFLLKKPLLCAYDLKFNWSNWIVLIKSEFLIAAGQEWSGRSFLKNGKGLKCNAIDMKIIFYSKVNKSHNFSQENFYTKFWKWELLEHGNGLFHWVWYLSLLKRGQGKDSKE